VFDHDGVLVDSIGPDLTACRRLFAEHGAPLPAERWAREVCGNTDGYRGLFRLLTDPVPGADGDPPPAPGAAYGPADVPPAPPGTTPVTGTAAVTRAARPTPALLRTRLGELWRELLVPANVPLLPGVRELLTRLAGHGVRLAVASSADRHWVERMLDHHGLAPLFDAVVGGDDVARRKPAPDVYLEALARLDTAPEHALAVEDSLTGVEAARAAGLRVVAVPTPYTRSLDYGRAHATLTGLDLLTDALLPRILREDDHAPDAP